MSWHYSRALVGEYLAANCLDGELFAPLKSKDTPETYCWQDRMTETLNLFQFGMMSAPLTANLGGELLMWYRGDFLVKTCQSRVLCGDATVLRVSNLDYGGRCLELLSRYSHPMFLVKTHQSSKITDCEKSLSSLPASGMYRDGVLLELKVADLIINATGYGSRLPTPTRRDFKDTFGMNPTRKDGKTRTDRLPMLLFESAKNAGINSRMFAENMDVQTVNLMGLANIEIKGPDYSPQLPEWIMGLPIGWTELKPLGMRRFQAWQLSHGKYL